MTTRDDLRAKFGGTWDGGGREIHGLVDLSDRILKIELLSSSDWMCSVFDAGACVATTRRSDAIDAVGAALDMVEE